MTRAFAIPAMRRPRLSWTLTGYITRQFLVVWLGFFLGLCMIILLVSMVDLLDRFGNREGATLGTIFELALLKLPYLSLEIMPFTVLFASLATFWRLTRSHELVVTRSAGVSVWQFLLPSLLVAVALGCITMMVLNPLSSILLSRYDNIETRFSKSSARSALAVSKFGLWLRQADGDGQAVIHAGRLSGDSSVLNDVIIFRFGPNDAFLNRLDARKAALQEGRWVLSDVWQSLPGEAPSFSAEVEIPTELTAAKIQDSFAAPETISFWSLPNFIQLLEQSGFSALRHRLQWNRLLSTPLLLVAMVLIAATFSLRPQRRGKVAVVILAGALTGFLLYFVSNFVYALGLSSKIPIVLAGWAPAIASLMLGVALLLHLEDG